MAGVDERIVGDGRVRLGSLGPGCGVRRNAVRSRILPTVALGGAVVGDRSRPASLDPLAELDERELAGGDLSRELSALLRVVDLQELVGVRERVFAQGHEIANLLGCVREAE